MTLIIAAVLAAYSAPRSLAEAERTVRPLPRPLVGGEAGVPGPQHNAHHLHLSELRKFLGAITRPLARFLVVWLISYTAINGVAVLFPVVMTHQYAVPAILPASAYAVGVAASLLLCRRVNRLAGRHGAGRV